MHTMARPVEIPPIVYPDRDGKPRSENTKQGRWIFTLYGNLTALFLDRADVFIAMDNLWYPMEGHPEVCYAPDVYVVFGRPKGDRGSYKQWEEDDIPLTVVFEILSPSNTVMEMDEKLDFYDEYGVEEYYLYDPDRNRLAGFVRKGEAFRKVRPILNHVSPRLGIRFDLSGPELVVYHPDGRRFLSFEELDAEVGKLRQRADQAERVAARLRELGRKARLGQATPEELRELEALEEPPAP